MRTTEPPEVKRPSRQDVDRLITSLDSAAADLDHIRALGNLAPAHLESLWIAAGILRAITSGDLPRAVRALLLQEGVTLPVSRSEGSDR